MCVRRSALAAGVSLLVLTAAGQQGPARQMDSMQPGNSLQPGQWIDVPYIAQTEEGCGAASLAMVMQYWEQKAGMPVGADAQYDAIQAALYDRRAHGIRASAVVGYLHAHGFDAFAVSGTQADLEEQIAKGRPLIAAIEPAAHSALHYVVVVGLDPARKAVLLNDPAQRKLLAEDSGRFAREWKATGNWLVIAAPAANKN